MTKPKTKKPRVTIRSRKCGSCGGAQTVGDHLCYKCGGTGQEFYEYRITETPKRRKVKP